MGKLEKVVVLFVLFLVAVILGVSLNAPSGVAHAEDTVAALERDEDPAPLRAPIQRNARPEGTQPARSAPVSRREAGSESTESLTQLLRKESARVEAQRAAQEQPQAPETRPLGPAGVLSTSRPEAASRPAQPEPTLAEPVGTRDEAEDGEFLRTLTGLAPSLSEEFMIYTWRDGDSFAAVAERYFGSRLHVNRLLRNNEGIEDRHLQPGDQILIPVQAPVEVASSEWSGATTYTVQSGDVLGTISNTVYGTSKNWRKIYDANRDILADPNQLEVGMLLRIPE